MRIEDRYELAMELMRSVPSGRSERGDILDAFCLATGYHQKALLVAWARPGTSAQSASSPSWVSWFRSWNQPV